MGARGHAFRQRKKLEENRDTWKTTNTYLVLCNSDKYSEQTNTKITSIICSHANHQTKQQQQKHTYQSLSETPEKYQKCQYDHKPGRPFYYQCLPLPAMCSMNFNVDHSQAFPERRKPREATQQRGNLVCTIYHCTRLGSHFRGAVVNNIACFLACHHVPEPVGRENEVLVVALQLALAYVRVGGNRPLHVSVSEGARHRQDAVHCCCIGFRVVSAVFWF